MSADSRLAARPVARWKLSTLDIRVLRYAVGSTIAMAVAMAFAWQLAFLAPVLTVSFLASPAPRPSWKVGLGVVAIVVGSCGVGLLLGNYLIAYPLVHVPFMSLLLFRVFYVKAGGQAKLLTTLLLISLLVIPMITMSSPAIAGMVAAGIALSAIVAICVIWLVHGLIPDPQDAARNTGGAEVAAADGPPAPSSSEQFRTASISTLVVLPVFILFYAFQMTNSLLILIFVALLSSQPGFATNFKLGAGLIIGNVLGGAAAILFYQLLVMMPSFGFLVLLTLLAGLVFGTRAFSDKPTAKLFGMAYTTLLLVIGSVTAGGDDAAGAKVYERITQIIIAVVYVVMASGIADRFIQRKRA